MIYTDTQDVVNEIITNNPYMLLVGIILIFVAFIFIGIILLEIFILKLLTLKKRKEYLDSLTENEVSIISKYLHIKATLKDLRMDSKNE